MRTRSTDDLSARRPANLRRFARQLQSLARDEEESTSPQDIGEGSQVESQSAWERKLLNVIIDQVPDYLYLKDRQSRFVIANRAVAADLGLTPEELLGKTDFDVHPPDLARKFFRDEQEILRSGEAKLDIQEYVEPPSGSKKWLSTSKVPLIDDDGNIVGIVGVARDITDRKMAEERIHFFALHDPLTELPNRVLLMDRLNKAIQKADLTKGRVAVVFSDLDHFKLINDTLGHKAGDELLKGVARCLAASLRASETVARIGGDEFVVLIEQAPDDRSDPSAAIERIAAALSEPIVLTQRTVHVSLSMGVAIYPGDATDADMLLVHADAAMYEAKQGGRNTHRFFRPGLNDATRDRWLIGEAIREALREDQFYLEYQPQLDLADGSIVAVEALARWQHPVLGNVPPSKFIPVAEENGTIAAIGDWVLRQACRQSLAWQQAGVRSVVTYVNVSPRQFADPFWVDRIEAILRSTGYDPSLLGIEVTESVLMSDAAHAVETMRFLRALGIDIAIDDFGTGYSSLSALTSFPVTSLKIDRSLIQHLGREGANHQVSAAVIALGNALGMKVVAEGVEASEQITTLKRLGCRIAQGFYLAGPMAAERISELLASGQGKVDLSPLRC